MRWIRLTSLMLLCTLLMGCMARPGLSPAETLSAVMPDSTSAAPTPTATPIFSTVSENPSSTLQTLHSGGMAVVRAEEFISLRISDSTHAERICKLPAGSCVRVLKLHSAFARVETPDGQRGYVLHEYLKPTDETFTAPQMQPGVYTVVCKEYLTLRAQGSYEAEELARLDPGSAVELLRAGNAFAQVYAPDADLTGWVLCDYLTPGCIVPEQADVTTDPSNEPGAQSQTFTVRCKQYLTLRAQPDTGAQVVTTLPNGAGVRFMGERSGPFYRVTYGEEEGWVLSGYLKTAELPQLDVVQIVQSYAYEDMLADCEELARRYPSQARLTSVGKSEKGRTLAALIVGNEDAPHHILIQAAMHGREHMTALLLMAQVETLLRDGEIPQDVCLHVLPMTNPDGVTISQTQQMTDALRRIYEAEGSSLDEQAYLKLWKANANGVDLNRNFDADHRLGIRASSPASKLYPGKTAENQDESRALADYVRANDFDLTISYHAYGSVIYWQYGDDAQTNAASHNLAEAIAGQTGYTLKGDSGTEGGGFKDWALSVMGIPSVTIEIGTRSCPLPLDEFSDIWMRNQNVLPTLIQYVRD